MKLAPEHEARIAAASSIARESKCVCGETNFKSIFEFNRHKQACAKAREEARKITGLVTTRFVPPKSKKAGA
jgi:hypothetical protein